MMYPWAVRYRSTADILVVDFDSSGRITMADPKQEKQEKKAETTAEFVARMSNQDEKRNGRRVRFGFTKRVR